MAQAQQIHSIILQNHESTWIVNQKFFEIKYINESKHSKKHETDDYRKNQGNSHMFLQPHQGLEDTVTVRP